jgi:hypothetical protein
MAWVNTSPLVKTYTLDEFWRLPDPPNRLKIELIAGFSTCHHRLSTRMTMLLLS